MTRRVRTPGGSRFYDLPIGAIITRDAILAAKIKFPGKNPPKGASMHVSSSAQSPAAAHTPSAGGMNFASPHLNGPHIPGQHEGGPGVGVPGGGPNPSKPTFDPTGTIGGPKKFSVGSKDFSAPEGSHVFNSKSHDVAYVTTPDGELHVFTPSGEVTDLNSVIDNKLKSQLAAKSGRYSKDQWEDGSKSGLPDGPKGVAEPTNYRADVAPMNDPAEKDVQHIGDAKYGDYSIKVGTKEKDKKKHVVVARATHDPSGKEVGSLYASGPADKPLKVNSVNVDAEHRRKGVASAMLGVARREKTIDHNPEMQSPAGKAFAKATPNPVVPEPDVRSNPEGVGSSADQGGPSGSEAGGNAQRPGDAAGGLPGDTGRGAAGDASGGRTGAAGDASGGDAAGAAGPGRAGEPGGSGGVPQANDAGRGNAAAGAADRSAVPGSGDSGSGGPRLLIGGREVATKRVLPANPNAEAQKAVGVNVPTIYELDAAKEAATFEKAMQDTRALTKYGASVHVYPVDDYKKMRLFLSEDGKAGFALNGDEMISLFSPPGSRQGRALVASQIAEGGRRGDAFDTVLPHIYALEGFRTVARLKWDDSQAPDGWDKSVFKDWNNGEPDVVFLSYDPNSVGRPYVPGEGERVQTYDEGLAVAEGSNDGFGIAPPNEPIPDNAARFVQNWKGQTARKSMVSFSPDMTDAQYEAQQKEERAWEGTATQAETQAWDAANPPTMRDLPGRPTLGDWLKYREEQKAAKAGRPVRNPQSLGEKVPPPEPKDIAAMRLDDAYSKDHVDENGQFTPERQALHDKIVQDFLDGLKPVDNPTQFMNGGGPAAGKSAMGRFVDFPPTRKVDDITGDFVPLAPGEAPGAALIDPDAIKMQLPEVKQAMERLRNGIGDEFDKSWAGHSHEESSIISARIHQAALDRGYNLILDGTGDSSAKSVIGKVDRAHANGYRVEANYLYLEPQEGIRRAQARGERSHRFVPTEVIQSTYAKLPSIFDQLKDAGAFDHVNLFDNNRDGRPARLVGSGDGRTFEIKDLPAYNRFMSSSTRTAHGEETIAPLPDDASSKDPLDHQADETADVVMGKVVAIEPKVTATMQSLAAEHGGELQGLPNRFKRKASLKRKILADAHEFNLTPSEAGANMADALRYTMVSEPDTHTAMIESVLNHFEAEGYKSKVKNFWARGGAYRGTNAQLEAPDGSLIELQFNTPESLRIKDINHQMYNVQRELPRGDPRRAELDAEMTANSNSIPVPPGIEGVKERNTLTPLEQRAPVLPSAPDVRPSNALNSLAPEDIGAAINTKFPSVDLQLQPQDYLGKEDTFEVSLGSADGSEGALSALADWADASGWTLESPPIDNAGEDLSKKFAPFAFIAQPDGSLKRVPVPAK